MDILQEVKKLKAANDDEYMVRMAEDLEIIEEYLELTEYDFDTFEDCEAANDAHAYVTEHFGIGE